MCQWKMGRKGCQSVLVLFVVSDQNLAKNIFVKENGLIIFVWWEMCNEEKTGDHSQWNYLQKHCAKTKSQCEKVTFLYNQ